MGKQSFQISHDSVYIIPVHHFQFLFLFFAFLKVKSWLGCCLLKKQAHLAAFEAISEVSIQYNYSPCSHQTASPLCNNNTMGVSWHAIRLRFRYLLYSKISDSKSFRCYQFISGRSIHTGFYSGFNYITYKWMIKLSLKFNQAMRKLTQTLDL